MARTSSSLSPWRFWYKARQRNLSARPASRQASVEPTVPGPGKAPYSSKSSGRGQFQRVAVMFTTESWMAYVLGYTVWSARLTFRPIRATSSSSGSRLTLTQDDVLSCWSKSREWAS